MLLAEIALGDANLLDLFVPYLDTVVHVGFFVFDGLCALLGVEGNAEGISDVLNGAGVDGKLVGALLHRGPGADTALGMVNEVLTCCGRLAQRLAHNDAVPTLLELDSLFAAAIEHSPAPQLPALLPV